MVTNCKSAELEKNQAMSPDMSPNRDFVSRKLDRKTKTLQHKRAKSLTQRAVLQGLLIGTEVPRKGLWVRVPCPPPQEMP